MSDYALKPELQKHISKRESINHDNFSNNFAENHLIQILSDFTNGNSFVPRTLNDSLEPTP
jgi:hypothetical protein